VPVAGQTLFYYTDQISSSVLVVDEAGEPRTRVSYDAFGAIDEGASFGENDFRAKFAGLELASEVDLYLNAGRFYDPLIGRFVSADANRIGTSTDTAVQFNRYAYGANNPVTHTDPTGGSAQSILFDIGLAAIAVAATVLVPGGGIIAVAEVGAYFGGAAVNHSYDPASWNYKSWQTYAGMAAGIAVSAAGLAISIAAPEAIPEEAGVLATFLAGVAVDSVVGFAENATFAALGGASRDEILKQGLIGAATGAAFSALGQGVSAGVSRIANRATRSAAEAGEESSSLGTRSAGAAERGEAAAGGELEVRGGCNASFAAGTLVATPEGRVPIESLPLRSQVLARAADDGRTELRMVTAVYQRNSEDGILLQMPGGEVLTTAEHPFLHADGYWLAASELSAGDLLYGESGPVPLLAVSWQPQPLAVHNLSVSGLQTFVVGPDGVVVHNVNHWCTSRNAADLRDNMNQSGQAEPNFQNSAHHIVESTDPSPYMVKARSHLQAMGIDINHAGNGVFLARSSRVQRGITKGKWRNAYPHSRVHTKAYKRTVWKTIKTAKNRTQTLAKLRGLRTRLLNGNLPGAQINWP
jgi:RHS repeat-associated protein